jgi:hypothetical protein
VQQQGPRKRAPPPPGSAGVQRPREKAAPPACPGLLAHGTATHRTCQETSTTQAERAAAEPAPAAP